MGLGPGHATREAKRALGAFYTPAPVVAAALAHVADGATSVADLSCGDGAWLAAAAARWPAARLTGVDIDPAAIAGARRRLGPRARLRVADGAGTTTGERFDLIVGNPPWGAGRSRHVRRGEESASRFVLHAVARLNIGGRLCLLVPAAWLEVAAHRRARRQLLAATAIERLEHLGDVFPGVFAPAALIIARREPDAARRAQQLVATPHGPILQRMLDGDGDGGDCVLNPRLTARERLLVDKLDGARERLAGRVRFILGVVTGDNKRALGPTDGDGEPILSGTDVTPMRLAPPRKKLSLPLERVQQAAPRSAYRRDKIVYRFVAKEPVAAVDRQGRLTLNSANAIAIDDEFLDLDFVAAWLNSAPVAFVHRARQAMPRVLRSHLERLPLPRADGDERRRIVQAALVGDRETLDARMMDLYALDDDERELVKAWPRS
jgi:SAM-dependent methyltransferase